MATLANAADVTGIINFDPSITNLQPFIDAAHELVMELCAPLTYTQTRLKIIETWLAAHFLAVRDPNHALMMEDLGEQQVEFQRPMAGRFGSTIYGQQALMLDTQGGLAYIANHPSQGKRAKVGIMHLGHNPYRREGRYGEFWLFDVM